MKLKQKLAAAAIAAIAATATTSVLAQAPADAFTSTDMASLFEQDAQPLQLAALSEQEMKTTEGAWFWWKLPQVIKIEADDGHGNGSRIRLDLFGELYFRKWW